ncbi:site-specific tyrosine recombinase XerD [Granulicatella sp. 19428wC4_WM01]|nr:site-specific tyrosine recombinase XerD [Granulicatella sp. 19428wC4_WM01]MBF0780559.1 site-specific tyrosine recombinase XerD [Granulicatella sp. 19428wC4_WM01]TFU94911.1 site-specific tyrosine recombinase XerD [Granulicatella sp. WM01]
MLNKLVIKDFLIELQEIGLAKNSVDSYQIDLNQYYHFLVSTYKVEKWHDVTQDHIRHFLASLYDEGIKSTSASRKISALRKFHKFLKNEAVTSENPMSRIELPKKRKNLPTFLSEEEINLLLDTPDCSTLKGIRDKAILEVMYATGMRVSEVCELKISQVHLDTKMIHIIGKGNKERIVILGELAIEALEKYYQFVRLEYCIETSGDYVFLNRRGKHFTRQGIWKLLKELLIQAGITKKVTPHTIRHSIATHLLTRGMDLRTVQELLGHEHLVTTQIYTHLEKKKIMDEYIMAHPHAKSKGEEI